MSQRDTNDELDPEIQAETSESDETPSVEDLAAAAAEAEASEAETAELSAALEQKTREAAEAQDRYLRTYADFENYRKRTQRDALEFRKYAVEQIALDLLTVVDHLSLAIKHAQDTGGSAQGLQEGVELVHKQFLDVLEKYGIKPFKAEGALFDPRLHDAMMQVETSEAPENTVIQVFQDGYMFHEKVLRHAKVSVSKRPTCAAPGEEPAEGTTADESVEDLDAED